MSALRATPPPPQDPPPQDPPTARAPTHTGTAVSPSRQRLDEVRGSSAVWWAVRPDNQGGYPVEPVRYGHTGRGSPPLAQAEIQTKPNPPLSVVPLFFGVHRGHMQRAQWGAGRATPRAILCTDHGRREGHLLRQSQGPRGAFGFWYAAAAVATEAAGGGGFSQVCAAGRALRRHTTAHHRPMPQCRRHGTDTYIAAYRAPASPSKANGLVSS